MPKNARYFGSGGAYACGCCGRRTRATGRGDNEHVRLCAECYDLAGIENEMSDSGETPELLAEAAELRKVIVEKGGKIDA